MSFLKKCAVWSALNSLALVAAYPQAPSPTPSPVPADQTSPTAPTTPAAAPAAAAAPTWSIGGIDFSGTVDGYFTFNSNHPDAPNNFNTLYNFNDKADSFDLSMAKITINHDPDPVGAHIDFGFGRTFDDLHAADPDSGEKYLEQAFVSIKPPKWKGFEADFGQFVTTAGAEVIEAKDNWNYSRSLLFTNAIPYFHFGLRTTMPVTKAFTAGVQVVNGWNNIEDNNSGKTIGLTGAYVKTKYSWFGNYYVGPENTSTNKGFRNLLDTTLLLTPPGKLNAYLNYDYGQNRNAAQVGGGGEEAVLSPGVRPLMFNNFGLLRDVTRLKPADNSLPYITTDLTRWQGVAIAAHYQATPTIAITPRGEFYTTNTGPSELSVGEITLTGEYKVMTGVLARLEYRGDFADAPIYLKGSLGEAKQQNTFTVALVGFFGPKR
ncbi:MAG TPA: outer membrane beta-barrel protein [Acidisarcina sp.]